MSVRMPVVFVSHGAPDVLLNAPDTVEYWRKLGQLIPMPISILAISAHWEETRATVSLSKTPETIHDFSGFHRTLYHLNYSAPGAPELAKTVTTLLCATDINAELHPQRGLDHGVWVPLSAMYPKAQIPVTQLSLVVNQGPEMHFKIGRALTSLRDAGVLIIASGSVTHNFTWLNRHNPRDTVPTTQARDFSVWVAKQILAHDVTALFNYRDAPYGAAAHPSEEHFLPLFIALGAASNDAPVRYQPDFTYGSLSMDAYLWTDKRNGKKSAAMQ